MLFKRPHLQLYWLCLFLKDYICGLFSSKVVLVNIKSKCTMNDIHTAFSEFIVNKRELEDLICIVFCVCRGPIK